jgi:hypothetical protein
MSDYRDRGEAYKTDVHHQVWITDASPTGATVVDVYTATSVSLDPTTKQPLDNSQPIVEQRRDAFRLALIDGSWKVVDEPPED